MGHNEQQITPKQEIDRLESPGTEVTQEQIEILGSAEKFAEHLISFFFFLYQNCSMTIEVD